MVHRSIDIKSKYLIYFIYNNLRISVQPIKTVELMRVILPVFSTIGPFPQFLYVEVDDFRLLKKMCLMIYLQNLNIYLLIKNYNYKCNYKK